MECGEKHAGACRGLSWQPREGESPGQEEGSGSGRRRFLNQCKENPKSLLPSWPKDAKRLAELGIAQEWAKGWRWDVDSGEARKPGRVRRRGSPLPSQFPRSDTSQRLSSLQTPATPPSLAPRSHLSPIRGFPGRWLCAASPAPPRPPPLPGTPGCPAPRFQGRRGVALQRPATTSGKALA